MNTDQLAQRWHTSKGRLANMRSEGCGPKYFKIGTRVLYRLEEVIAFEDSTMITTAGAA